MRKDDFFTSGNTVKIIDFIVGDNHLGLNIQKTKEIVEISKVGALPEVYYPFVGQLDLRGCPVPIVHLPYFFQETKKPNLDELLKMKVVICEFQKMLIGFTVERIGKIHSVNNSQIRPVAMALDISQKRLFNGVVELGGHFINMLDIELILEMLQIDLGFSKEISVNAKFSNKTVLLVEDSKLFQKKLNNFFKKMGMTVLLAEDGLRGIELLKQYHKEIDLIFTDIEMPYLNGIGMVRQIKNEKLAEDTPIIFNTSISNPALIDDIKSEQLGDYIVKFDEELILQKVQTAFAA